MVLALFSNRSKSNWLDARYAIDKSQSWRANGLLSGSEGISLTDGQKAIRSGLSLGDEGELSSCLPTCTCRLPRGHNMAKGTHVAHRGPADGNNFHGIHHGGGYGKINRWAVINPEKEFAGVRRIPDKSPMRRLIARRMLMKCELWSGEG